MANTPAAFRWRKRQQAERLHQTKQKAWRLRRQLNPTPPGAGGATPQNYLSGSSWCCLVPSTEVGIDSPTHCLYLSSLSKSSRYRRVRYLSTRTSRAGRRFERCLHLVPDAMLKRQCFPERRRGGICLMRALLQSFDR